jgi:predicted phosphodiesterase
MSLYAVIGDIHGPWEDERAVDLFLYICKDLGVTNLILNGDILDFYNINAHGPKDPDVQTNLEDEIEWGRNFLARLKKELPKTKITYIFGNHEYRLDRFIMKNAPVFWNMLRLDKMLELERLGIDWVPYNERYQVEDTSLFVQHSPPSYSQNLANTSLQKKMDPRSYMELRPPYRHGSSHWIQW